MQRRLAIIPARGGSKRIPNKNVRDFCGSPMITHILRTASKSGLFQKIHVSTEDERIRSIAADYGFPPDFARPAELADDHTPIMPVLRYVAREFQQRGEQFDQIWLLMACAPLLRPEDLQHAADFFYGRGGETQVLSVTQFPVPIEWGLSLDENRLIKPARPEMLAVRSQDLEPHYFDAGAFAIYPAHQLLSQGEEQRTRAVLGYGLPSSRVVDIDTSEDWSFAEKLYHALSMIK